MARLTREERAAMDAAKDEARRHRVFLWSEFCRWFNNGRPLSAFVGERVWKLRGKWSVMRERK